MMKKRCLLLSLALFILVVAFTGPVAGDAGRSLTVIDDAGETVTIQGIPQRIVSLAPSNTEILYAIGLEDRIVGVTDYCDYPPAAAGIQKIGGYKTISVEKVLAADPDLILAAPGSTDDVVDRLRALSMTVLSLDPGTIDDVLRDIELLGRVTGQEEQAAACMEGLRLRISAVTEKTDSLAERPTVVHVVWHDPIWISGNGTFQNEV
ncbi:MAG: ABC transporter substrate-binding protein, partial [Methanomicrobiales archaeon]|nr:ABC transporter substrate-binding protein [Methanomicrobiales archaeon]